MLNRHDGSYTIRWRAERCGPHWLEVRLNNQLLRCSHEVSVCAGSPDPTRSELLVGPGTRLQPEQWNLMKVLIRDACGNGVEEVDPSRLAARCEGKTEPSRLRCEAKVDRSRLAARCEQLGAAAVVKSGTGAAPRGANLRNAAAVATAEGLGAVAVRLEPHPRLRPRPGHYHIPSPELEAMCGIGAGRSINLEGAGAGLVRLEPASEGEVDVWVFGSRRGWVSLEVTVDGRHVRGSPAELRVAAGGATPRHCFATGAGVGSSYGIFCNEPSRFAVVACDATGAPRSEGGDVFRVCITPRHAGTESLICHDLGDGTYAVSWTPVVPGRYSVHITVESVHIRGSPYRINVGPRRGPPPFALGMSPSTGWAAATRYAQRGVRSEYERAAVAAAYKTDAGADVQAGEQGGLARARGQERGRGRWTETADAGLLARVAATPGQCQTGCSAEPCVHASHRRVAGAWGAGSPERGAGCSPAAARARGAVSLLPSERTRGGMGGYHSVSQSSYSSAAPCQPVGSPVPPWTFLWQAWLETGAAEGEVGKAAECGEAAVGDAVEGGKVAEGESLDGPFAVGPLDRLLSRFRRVLREDGDEDEAEDEDEQDQTRGRGGR